MVVCTMVIDIRKISAELKIKLPDLITRPVGRRIYARILKQLEHAGGDEVVVLDFEGIKVIDSSFIDECIIRLIKDSRESDKRYFIKLKNISDITEINLDSVLNSYYMYNSDKIAVVTDRITRNRSCFLGTLSKEEKDIIDYLRINKIVRADELAVFMELPAEETAAIAEGLYKIRILRKDESGGSVRYIAV